MIKFTVHISRRFFEVLCLFLDRLRFFLLKILYTTTLTTIGQKTKNTWRKFPNTNTNKKNETAQKLKDHDIVKSIKKLSL